MAKHYAWLYYLWLTPSFKKDLFVILAFSTEGTLFLRPLFPCRGAEDKGKLENTGAMSKGKLENTGAMSKGKLENTGAMSKGKLENTGAMSKGKLENRRYVQR